MAFLNYNFQRLVIIQTQKQFQHYIKKKKIDKDLILPIGPTALFLSDTYKINFINLKQIWKMDEYIKSAKKSQKLIDNLIRKIDEFSKKKSINIEIGSYYAFQIWIIIGQINYNAFIVKSIIKNLKPKEILIYSKSNEKNIYTFRPDPECIFENIANNHELIKGVKINILKLKEKNFFNLKFFLNFILPNSLIVLMKFFKINPFSIFIKSSSKKKLLLVGGHYDWIKVKKYKAFNDIFTFNFINQPSVSKKNFKSYSQLKSIIFESLPDIKASNLDFLENFIKCMSLDFSIFSNIKERISNQIKSSDALVSSVFTFPWENFLAHIANQSKIPVFIWQHGEKGQAEDLTIPYTEIKYANYYLAYGDEIKKYYSKWIGKYNFKKVISIGSLSKNITVDESKNIVYATGKWFKTATPFPVLPDPDLRTYKAHKEILGYLNNLNHEGKNIFKSNNTIGFNEIPYSYENVIIDSKTPFTQLIKKAKIIILDTPATTLVEACSTNIPIFVLGGRINYDKFFIKIIKKRVIWCESVDILIKKINLYITKKIYEADIYNKSYSEKYFSTKKDSEIVFNINKVLSSILEKESY